MAGAEVVQVYLLVPSEATRSVVNRPGEYTVYVGTAADDTPHTATVTVASAR